MSLRFHVLSCIANVFLLALHAIALESQHRSFRGAPKANQGSILLGRVEDIGDLSESDLPDVAGYEEKVDDDEQEPDVAEGDEDEANGSNHDEDEGDEPQEDELQAEGEGHIERLQRVGRLADANNDTLLSAQELRQFAEGLRERKRWEHTDAAVASLDADGDGKISMAELGNKLQALGRDGGSAIEAQRFDAADQDANGVLDRNEFHVFAHPELGGQVLRVEAAYQFERFDEDRNGSVTFAEFKQEAQDDDDFSEDSVREDFDLHDTDGSGTLDSQEFEHLVQGHHLLTHSINKAIGAADTNGDGHIHVHDEVPHHVEGLLDSEFIEDFFFHEYTSAGHLEL